MVDGSLEEAGLDGFGLYCLLSDCMSATVQCVVCCEEVVLCVPVLNPEY